ncbi:SOS response-associated peptidase [Paenibacillus urinalis]|uniref:Abasic site processing protein n=1 Tax=Paenibacillus urinalis TaxID=521520 RepID=A0AAX3N648_9BACL|nr:MULTISPECIES: SOS response-associated peptidase [Paenibacillus]WDH84668.1 SOS response-associated peptidase [Paenibacillus urinalis]WDH96130.1 SOS response-associated peptidase [Paenibacillus urinalis]WDI04351.1 SOS response-associated peptidase [Paenibacillus urinalis]GAK38315.1 hypothetical protein TCA2_0041 [Paenibacillus sp. TCA20]
MCKRYSLAADLDEVRDHFGIQRVMYYYKNRYNISPTQHAPIILYEDGERIMDEYRWGFIPFWGKDAVNADLMSVSENVTYRKMVEQRRCVIPCNGFYYWRQDGKRRYAVRVVMPDRSMFGIAGLYEVWKDTRKQPLRTCTMLMSDANMTIREFDHRMPAILTPDQIDAWLDPKMTEMHRMLPMIRSFQETLMDVYPVTPLAFNDNHDSLECVKEVDMQRALVKN